MTAPAAASPLIEPIVSEESTGAGGACPVEDDDEDGVGPTPVDEEDEDEEGISAQNGPVVPGGQMHETVASLYVPPFKQTGWQYTECPESSDCRRTDPDTQLHVVCNAIGVPNGPHRCVQFCVVVSSFVMPPHKHVPLVTLTDPAGPQTG